MRSKYKHGSLQHVILMVPESCPKVALRCETKMIGMKWRIWQEKILLLLRIKKHKQRMMAWHAGLWWRGNHDPEPLSGMPSMVGAEAGAGDDVYQ